MTLKLIDLIFKGETATGPKLQNTIIVSAWSGRKKYRLLFDHKGNLLTDKNTADAISNFYDLPFEPGFLDGVKCFIHKEK